MGKNKEEKQESPQETQVEIKEPTPLALHYKIIDYIEKLKSKSKVDILDLEQYFKFTLSFDECVTELQRSRARWRIRAETAEKQLKEVMKKNGN